MSSIFHYQTFEITMVKNRDESDLFVGKFTFAWFVLRNPDLTVFPQIGPEKVRGSDVPCHMDRELHGYRFLFSFPIPVSVSSA